MSDNSIYQPPLVQPPPNVILSLPKPAVVTVFGILHLVFATIGILTAIWGLIIALTGNPFLKMLPDTPEMRKQVELQTNMQHQLDPMTIVTSILSLLVAVPMIIGGIQMLRSRKSGLKWSNIYGWSSLFAKAVNIVLAVTVVLPAMSEVTNTIPASSRGLMSGSILVGAIGGALVSCIYPILTLVLLNRGASKAWFASLTK